MPSSAPGQSFREFRRIPELRNRASDESVFVTQRIAEPLDWHRDGSTHPKDGERPAALAYRAGNNRRKHGEPQVIYQRCGLAGVPPNTALHLSLRHMCPYSLSQVATTPASSTSIIPPYSLLLPGPQHPLHLSIPADLGRCD